MSDTQAVATNPGTPGLRMIRTLGLIAMLSGLAVVLVYQWTAPIIAENQRIATEKAVFHVVAGATTRQDFRLGAGGLVPAGQEGEGETAGRRRGVNSDYVQDGV